ncbi:unnamed protein product [Chrysoparadoxa australica]
MVNRLRELCIRTSDGDAIDAQFFNSLVCMMRECKDKEWERKGLRYIHFFIRAVVTGYGDQVGEHSDMGSSALLPWESRGITSSQLANAVEAVRMEAEQPFLPRRCAGLRTLSILCLVIPAAVTKRDSVQSELRGTSSALKNAVLPPLLALKVASAKPEESKKKRGKKAQASGGDVALLLPALLSSAHVCPTLRADTEMLGPCVEACTADSPLAARHAFAILQHQAPDSAVQVMSYLVPLMVPTTVAEAGRDSNTTQSNLEDSLACVYYLRTLKTLSFSEQLDQASRLVCYRTIAKSVEDVRDRVALEAIQCLLDHDRAWELLLEAQRESRDSNLFRRIVVRITQCLQGNNLQGKGEAKDSQMNSWPLIHAACRVCRVVGRTFQKAISFQTLSLNNKGVEAEAEASGGRHRGFFSGDASASNDAAPQKLLELTTPKPIPSQSGSGAAGADNTESVRDLCSALNSAGLLECPQAYIRSLAMQATFLLLPDPCDGDKALLRQWDDLQEKMEASPHTLPTSLLAEVVESLLVRVECSAAARDALTPIALTITESFVNQVPGVSMVKSMVGAWKQCIKYGEESRANVLESLYRVQDAPRIRSDAQPQQLHPSSSDKIDLGFATPVHASFSAADTSRPNSIRSVSDKVAPAATSMGGSSAFSSSPGSSPMRTPASSQHPTDQSQIHHLSKSYIRQKPKAKDSIGSLFPGTIASSLSAEHETSASSCTPAASAMAGLRCSVLWFLGEYCLELTGEEPPTAAQEGEGEMHAKLSNTANSLLGVFMPSSPPSPTSKEKETTLPHPESGGVSPAATSLMLRLKTAAMFEGLQMRHTALEAICKVALRMPDPVRHDAFVFLKGLHEGCSFTGHPQAPARPAPEEALPALAPASGASTQPAPERDEGIVVKLRMSKGNGLGSIPVLRVLRQLESLYEKSGLGVDTALPEPEPGSKDEPLLSFC